VNDSTSLGDRMKAYERPWQTSFPRRLPIICRVDGRAFHSHLRHAAKPFDMPFIADMGHVATALCEEISGAVFAYHQSDEISVLVYDQGSNAEPWFAGEVQKVVSISASVATAALGGRRPGRPLFDSRVFVLPNTIEVANYFLWRQRDAVRNSIAMAAQAKFSANRLHGVNAGGMQELLHAEAGINWNDYPDSCRRGQVAVRRSGEKEATFTHKRTGQVETVKAMRSWWEITGAPHFSLEPGGFLTETIPPMPSLEQMVGARDDV
jgi:tRNA(His) guanylyltransferase